MDSSSWLSAADERLVYEQHENREQDVGYRRYLAKFTTPVLAHLAPRSQGLDYGCGPGPTLAAVLREAGHEVALYDPFFANDPAVLTQTYDFVVCTETAEHFQRPAQEFDRINALVRPGGLIALMTCFQTRDDAFANWYYRRDPTHVVFYRAATMAVLATRYGWRCTIPTKDVALFVKPA